MTIPERLAALRGWMARQQTARRPLGAYLVPTADPHADEYIPAHWACREWLTGFTGSAGTVVVTADRAALWTDSRYWLQAADELAGTGIELMRDGAEGTPTVCEWIAAQPAFAHCTDQEECPLVGAPADLVTRADVSAIASAGCGYARDLPDAFSAIWTDRPALPAAPIDVADERYAAAPAKEKLARLREWTAKNVEGNAYLVNDLSDIAWLLNLRGADIPYNPVFVAYLLCVGPGHAAGAPEGFTLFTHGETLTPAARRRLMEAGVAVRPYAEATAACSKLFPACDVHTTALCIADVCDRCRVASPVGLWRAVKSEAEAAGFRLAMERDGVAMVRFLRWLDEQMAAGEEVTELSVDERLTALRAGQAGYEQLSFGTIAACGAHAAIVHYEADEASSVRLPQSGMLLLDSGAQYDCGTTDITRTIALGPLTDEERRAYTLVFKGHLRLQRMQFPDGTTGLQLDLAARQDLWAAGLDFGHGTGHGVGAHLCVHEGPHQIRKDVRPATLVPLRAGMTVTDEPGLYVEGRFGVRIENTLLIVPAEETAFGRFLRFEPLTLCPYDLRPVILSLLSPEEVEQINTYHAEVRQRLMPLLADDADREWLARATRSLDSASED